MNPVSPPSLDHLRIFAAVVDSGSFSAAARLLDRSQPAVSYAIATMEAQLGLTLFERGRRKPVLTQAGIAILAYARRIGQLSDELAANASSLTAGLEATLALAADTFFPTPLLARALQHLAERFPSLSVDLRIVSREQVLQQVVDGEVVIGISSIDIAWPPGIEARDFGQVEIMAMAAPIHPLAQHQGPIPTMVLRDSLQITNRAAGLGDEARDLSVNSSRIWRVGSLGMQIELLRQGIGWGYLPLHAARADLDSGHLVQLNPATRQRGVLPWSLIFRAARPPGPAARLLCDQLEQLALKPGIHPKS